MNTRFEPPIASSALFRIVVGVGKGITQLSGERSSVSTSSQICAFNIRSEVVADSNDRRLSDVARACLAALGVQSCLAPPSRWALTSAPVNR